MFGQLGRDLARRADNPRVRLESDTLGGELRVRASIVDEHGHAENFRRLEVRVAGPDGFSATLPLEAAGAGSYAGSLPLARPGAYVATAVDEQSNEALATSAAALSAGEELRPTGTDRGLLRRVTQVTGGKMRDTLAGIFSDREALRFAYQNLNQLLVLLSAALLLLGVAARRLAMPDFAGRAATTVGSWVVSARARRSMAQRTVPSPQRETLQSLREAKTRTEAALGPTQPFAIAATTKPEAQNNIEPAPASTPRFSQPPASSAAISSNRPPTRKPTAAEVLLARRRGRKS
jgi:hypothetical protein